MNLRFTFKRIKPNIFDEVVDEIYPFNYLDLLDVATRRSGICVGQEKSMPFEKFWLE